jgi:hypothetical protein
MLIKVKKNERRRKKAKSEKLFYHEYAKDILGDSYKFQLTLNFNSIYLAK